MNARRTIRVVAECAMRNADRDLSVLIEYSPRCQVSVMSVSEPGAVATGSMDYLDSHDPVAIALGTDTSHFGEMSLRR